MHVMHVLVQCYIRILMEQVITLLRWWWLKALIDQWAVGSALLIIKWYYNIMARIYIVNYKLA